METLKQYKLNTLLVFTLILSIGIIGAITLRWYEFQQNIVSRNQNVSNNQDTNVTPTLPSIEDPRTELNLGNRIAGTEETIDVYSTNTVVQDQVELVRLFIENGEVLNVSSTLMAFPACSNEKMFTPNRVCLDVAKTSPMNVNELIAKITIKWDEDQEGKIWRENSAGIYVTEDVLGIEITNTPTFEYKTDNTTNITFGNTEQSFIETNEFHLIIILGALISILLIYLIFKITQKRKKSSKILNILVIIVEVVGIFILVENINSNYFYPEISRADVPTVERNQLVQPVLSVYVTMGYGDDGKNYTCNGGSCCFGPPGLCHTGIDLGVGQNIYAAGKGVVQQASYDNTGYGNTVIIRHNSSSGSYYTQYSHLANIKVGQGDVVDENTVVGYMGATGNVTGVHLHFELRNNLGYTASSFDDPTSIVHRQRGSAPKPQDPPQNPQNPKDTQKPIEPEKTIACGGRCNSDSQCGKGDNVKTVECDESVNPSNNKCIILSCEVGYFVNGCTCIPNNNNKPTTKPTASFVPTKKAVDRIICGPMDHDKNNTIDASDLVNFAKKYNKLCSDNYNDSKYGALDANHDGKIGYEDIIKFKSFYNKGVLF